MQAETEIKQKCSAAAIMRAIIIAFRVYSLYTCIHGGTGNERLRDDQSNFSLAFCLRNTFLEALTYTTGSNERNKDSESECKKTGEKKTAST